MHTRKLTKEVTATLDRIIAQSREARARYEAEDGRTPSHDDAEYLQTYYASRQVRLGYTTVG